MVGLRPREILKKPSGLREYYAYESDQEYVGWAGELNGPGGQLRGITGSDLMNKAINGRNNINMAVKRTVATPENNDMDGNVQIKTNGESQENVRPTGAASSEAGIPTAPPLNFAQLFSNKKASGSHVMGPTEDRNNSIDQTRSKYSNSENGKSMLGATAKVGRGRGLASAGAMAAAAAASGGSPNSNNKVSASLISTAAEVNNTFERVNNITSDDNQVKVLGTALQELWSDTKISFLETIQTLMALFSVLTVRQLEEIKNTNDTRRNSFLEKCIHYAESSNEAKATRLRDTIANENGQVQTKQMLEQRRCPNVPLGQQ